MEGAPKSEGRGARFWLIVALLISGLIGFLIGLVLPRFRRHEDS